MNKTRSILCALYTLCFGVVASALLVTSGFPLDDSYIYQAIARAAATPGAQPAYLPGHLFSGATSLLWVCLQAAKYKFAPGLSPVVFNLLISWCLFVSLGPLLWLMAARDGMETRYRWLLAATPALCGNLLWLGLLGMEHILFLVLSLLCIALWFAARGRSSAIYAGLCASVLLFVRPEACLLVPLLLLRRRPAGRSRADILYLVALWLCGLCVLMGCNLAVSGSLMPSTLNGRRWMWLRGTGQGSQHGSHSIQTVAAFAAQWIRRLPQLFSIHFSAIQIRLTREDWFFTLVAVSLTVCFLWGAVVLYRNSGPRIRLLLLWCAVHTGTYCVLLPASGHGGRYQPELLMLAFPLIFCGLFHIFGRLLPSMRVTGVALPSTLILLCGVSSLTGWRTISILGIQHVQATHGAMANWIEDNLPAQTRIAAFDIGKIAYSLNRPIADLGGLIDPAYLSYLESGRVVSYLQAQDIRYVILPIAEKQRDDLHWFDQANAEPLVTFCGTWRDWTIAYSFTASAWRCQRLYRIDSFSPTPK